VSPLRAEVEELRRRRVRRLQPQLASGSAACARRRGTRCKHGRELGIVGPKLIAIAPELIGLHVEPEHGHVQGDDSGEKNGHDRDPDRAAGDPALRDQLL
jgi:hypothetical protein